MTIRSILVAAVLALGFATAASATSQTVPAHQYTNTVAHNFYGQ
jgi:hypothetical protein